MGQFFTRAKSSFGMRELAPTPFAADSSVFGDSLRRVSAKSSGVESRHPKTSVHAGVVRIAG
jgi:hypothetical protein